MQIYINNKPEGVTVVTLPKIIYLWQQISIQMNIESCPICGNIPESEREEFLSSLKAVTRVYQKGEFIARQGDTVGSLYLLTTGSVKTEMITESGGVLAIETIVAPRPLAPAFLFAENNRFPVDVVALESCWVMMIPKASVMKQLATNENFLKSYMAFNANRTQFLSERLQLLSIKTIKGKLAYYIQQRSVGGAFNLDRNQTELAEYFGIARPSLARSFSEMIEEGAITREGKIANLNILKGYL